MTSFAKITVDEFIQIYAGVMRKSSIFAINILNFRYIYLSIFSSVCLCQVYQNLLNCLGEFLAEIL
jgi:hypothetical protein